ncbi:PhzF family phenazine biosynthesis protein [Caballeronia sp. GAFFF2]|uniref:PhzF family phenazine biosynthesis protein n=1 Tax=Caballeronia sp. GAFFF2 TaxID=2921741 RepID=UPI0020284533|nr:PhzF family phenazine biosynthesis protein [Caballeronia sp. GAFFF2]
MTVQPIVVKVFAAGANGGNPAPVVLAADEMSAESMRCVAANYGHESAFVLRPLDMTHDFRFRFFVPNHEMEMCGHATLGALWLLRRAGRWLSDNARIETLSGTVEAVFDPQSQSILVSQPAGRTSTVDEASLRSTLLDVLGLDADALLPRAVVNASTSRVKTLVPLRSVKILDSLRPDFARIEELCNALSSTGLYPFALDEADSGVFHARQFPRSSGYPEDAATGIAAAALFCGLDVMNLLQDGRTLITVRQGEAMGRPSAITVGWRDVNEKKSGYWLTGSVLLATEG